MLDKAWLWFIMVVGIVGMILSSSMDTVPAGSDLGGSSQTTQSVFTYLADIHNISYTSNSAGQVAFVAFNPTYFTMWMKVLAWDYSFLQGNDYASMFKFIVLYPITIVTLAMFGAMFTWMLSSIFGH